VRAADFMKGEAFQFFMSCADGGTGIVNENLSSFSETKATPL
jgi:hypothetical protein